MRKIGGSLHRAVGVKLMEKSRRSSRTGRKSRARCYPETDLQIALATALRRMLDPKVIFFSVPNEHNTTKARGDRLNRAGRLPGVADLIVSWADEGGRPRVMAIELKAPRGGSLTKNQREFLRRAREAGWESLVCRSIDSAIDALIKAGCPFVLYPAENSGYRNQTRTLGV